MTRKRGPKKPREQQESAKDGKDQGSEPAQLVSSAPQPSPSQQAEPKPQAQPTTQAQQRPPKEAPQQVQGEPFPLLSPRPAAAPVWLRPQGPPAFASPQPQQPQQLQPQQLQPQQPHQQQQEQPGQPQGRKKGRQQGQQQMQQQPGQQQVRPPGQQGEQPQQQPQPHQQGPPAFASPQPQQPHQQQQEQPGQPQGRKKGRQQGQQQMQQQPGQQQVRPPGQLGDQPEQQPQPRQQAPPGFVSPQPQQPHQQQQEQPGQPQGRKKGHQQQMQQQPGQQQVRPPGQQGDQPQQQQQQPTSQRGPWGHQQQPPGPKQQYQQPIPPQHLPPQQYPPQQLHPQQFPPQQFGLQQQHSVLPQQMEQMHIAPPNISQQQIPQKPVHQPQSPQQQAPQQQMTQQTVRQQQVPQQQQPQQRPSQTQVVPAKAGGDIFRVPRRSHPTGTKIGRKITVEVNYLSMNIGKVIEAIHHDVAIDPDRPKFMFRDVVKEFFRANFPGRFFAFDGVKNLYTSKPLPSPMTSTGFTYKVNINEEGRKEPAKFEITVKPVAVVDLSSLAKYMRQGTSLGAPRAALQCLDVVFRDSAISQLVRVGRSFFCKPAESFDLGDGLDLWYGHFQSAVLGWKPFINIDVAHKGFPKDQPVVDLIKDLSGRNYRAPLDPATLTTFEKFIKNLKISFNLPGQSALCKTYRVNGVRETPKRLIFQLDNGEKTNVFDFFLKEKNYRIQNPDLPCLWVGSQKRNICYPVELCTILPGQVITKRMTEKQTSSMIKKTAVSTVERKRKIYEAIKKINFNNNPSVKEFGVSVGNEFEKVDAQVLNAPALTLDRDTQPRDGVWTPSGFTKPMSLSSWLIISLDRYAHINEIQYMVKALQDAARKMRMQMAEPSGIQTNIQLKDLHSIFEDAKKKKVELVYAIVPPAGNYYSQVKQNAELKYGVLTQCMKSTTLKKMSPSTATNLLLKINTKLLGVNQIIKTAQPTLNRKFMVMGADVTHPAPDQKSIPSIAAVTASHDRFAYRYNITLRLQPARAEVIEQLKDMALEQLNYYIKINNFRPEVIMMFRDGVSEGQFEQVLNYELHELREACKMISVDYRPAITLIIVQKRHHTRFFPGPKDETGRNKNVPVGTMVDTIITHPTELDFYLVSHASIQGVARPTRYHCIHNGANLTDDELQMITYHLCHLFSRCARSVSYPAPTYYAHLACLRARVLTEGKNIDVDRMKPEERKLKILDDIVKGRPMFFV